MISQNINSLMAQSILAKSNYKHACNTEVIFRISAVSKLKTRFVWEASELLKSPVWSREQFVRSLSRFKHKTFLVFSLHCSNSHSKRLRQPNSLLLFDNFCYWLWCSAQVVKTISLSKTQGTFWTEKGQFYCQFNCGRFVKYTFP